MILVYLLFSCFLGIKRKRISYTSKPELLDRHIDNSHDNIIIEPESPVSGWHAFFFFGIAGSKCEVIILVVIL